MTREEAIEYAEKKNLKLEEEIERPGSYYGAYAMYSTELEFVSMAISALRQQWISVKDRLPEQTDPAQNVLFVTKTGGLFIGCYYKATAYDQFNGWYSMCVRIDNVTHWMPLPEMPEEEDKHENYT